MPATCQVLGMPPEALLTTHRLDAGTEGVLVLAKTSQFARFFNEMLRDKQDRIRKAGVLHARIRKACVDAHITLGCQLSQQWGTLCLLPSHTYARRR
jgi:23S rRNA-/tRNA-specific pseudouridylate synthase